MREQKASTVRQEIVLVLMLCLAWVATCAVVNPVGNFSINDDWVYGLSVKHLLQTGQYMLPSASSADVMTQVYWGALFCLPFGFSFTALRLSTLVLGLAGVLSMFGLTREAGGSRRIAVFAAFSLAADPLYFGLANSFMSDVPFLALLLVALWLFARGCRLDSSAYMLAAVILTLINVLVRQFAVLELLAFGVAYLFRYGFRWRTLAIAVLPTIAGVMLHFGYYHWMTATGRTPVFGHPAADLIPSSVTEFIKGSIKLLLAGTPYIGFVAGPFLIVSLLPAFARLRPSQRILLSIATAGGTLVLVVANRSFGTELPSMGNVLNLLGLGPFDLAGRLSPEGGVPGWLTTFWRSAAVLSSAGGLLGLGIWLRYSGAVIGGMRRGAGRHRLWFPALLVSTIASYGAILLLLGSTTPIYDRYFLPFGPLVCLLAVWVSKDIQPGRLVQGCTIAALAALAFFTIAGTHDYLALGRVRWHATDALLASGVLPQEVDAGYEFHGWYTGDGYHWMEHRPFLLSTEALPHYSVEAIYPFYRWLTQSKAQVVVLRRTTPAPQQ